MRHESRLLPHMIRSHIAFNFVFGRKRGDRVNYDDINLACAYQTLYNFERLFARVWLGNEQVTDVHSKFFGIIRIHGMFCVDIRAGATQFLRFGDDVQSERSFARRFRSEYFNNSTARDPAYSERHIEPDRSGGDGVYVHSRRVSQLHNRALTEFGLD